MKRCAMANRDVAMENATKNLASNIGNDIKRIGKRAQMTSQPYIEKAEKDLLFGSCYMCGNNDCEEIRFGDKRTGYEHIMFLCRDCQKKMAEFLLNE